MPGHKGFGTLGNLDITELSFTDDLRNPTGVIADSEKLYAAAVGAKFCHYLVNGSTSGLFALASMAEKCALVESNCHVALTNALSVLNKKFAAITPDKVDGVAVPLTLARVTAEVNANPEIDSVYITSPNYLGKTAELKAIFKFLKSKNIALYVDGAHGAHFGLNKALPDNCVDFCSATVQSTHKTLGSLTQTAVLLTNDAKLAEKLKAAVNIFTTTSPSFLLLASIESAIAYATDTAKLYNKLLAEVIRFKSNASKDGFVLYDNDDFTRLVFDCKGKPYTGYELQDALERLNVFCETATERFVVCILSLYDNGVILDALHSALKKMTFAPPKKGKQYTEQCFNNFEDM
jgi:arginine/lysine/ornithine decarboxylase